MKQNLGKRINRKHRAESSLRQNQQFHQPFWLSASNYYILTIAISIATFFLVWGVFHEYEEEVPWITAGIVASLILMASVILREFILRKIYQKFLAAQKRLDYNIKSVYKVTKNGHQTERLTLERNAEILREIERKSKAAKSISKLSAPHLEVFEMCEAYLQKSSRELGGIIKSSPRFAALNKGQERVLVLRRFHLLSWASLESQFYIQNSKVQATVNDKLENANRALEVLNSAIQFYSDEQKLIESVEVVKGFIVTIKVAHWIEQAEKSAFRGHHKKAINYYQDALYFLARENEQTPETDLMVEKINLEIEKLNKKGRKRISE